MKRDTLLIITLSIVFVVLFIIYIARGGYYPIALVHGEWVSNRRFNREHTVYANYYQEFGKAGRLVISDDETFKKQVGRDGLDRLIEVVLVERAVNDLGGREARKAVREQIDAEMSNPDIDQVRNLFGDISEKEFVRTVLEPQAERAVLAEYLASQDEVFDDWLNKTKGSARVIVFSDLYDWDGEKVVFE